MHLSEEALLQFTLGQLQEAAHTEAETHLVGCEACRLRQQSLSSIVFARTAAAPLPHAPAPPTNPDSPDAKASTPPALRQGVALGRYVLLDRLGAGGMGEVFAAYDPHLDRRVALKLLRVGALSAQEGRARLLREAQAMAKLQHPNVIAVHDVGTLGDHVFVAMEFVQGETLGEWLRGDRSWEQVLRLFLQAGEGLSAAHKAGLVHRDFKPDNVLIGEDGRPRVLDFGLARQAAPTPPGGRRRGESSLPDLEVVLDKPLTQDGAIMGTPGYMAPEQLAGLPTDARSDQFAFCVALFEGLHGVRPFGGMTLKAHAQAIASGVLPPASPTVPDWVNDVLKRGLTADPAGRFPDMAALLEALRPQQKRGARRLAAVAAIAVASTIAVAWGVQQTRRISVCGGGEQRLGGVWDPQVKKRVDAAFLATKLPYADKAFASVARSLDGYALELVNGLRESCEAARIRGSDSAALYELKSACLDERLERLRTLTRLFEAADKDVVANGSVAAHSLEPIATCLDRTQVSAQRQPERGGDEAAEKAFRPKLDEARAMYAAGKYAQGKKVLEAALGAELSAHSQAEGHVWLARLATRLADPVGEREHALRASEHAVRAGAPSLEAVALSRYALALAYDDAPHELDAFLKLGHAAAARTPADWETQTELARNDGLIALHARRLPQAKGDFERALAAYEQHLGPEHPEVATTLAHLGNVLAVMGDSEGAYERYQRAFTLREELEGPYHPQTASAAHNLAVALARLERYPEALTYAEKALSIRKEMMGPEHVETLNSAQALARLKIATRDFDGASALLNELLETRRRVFGAESKDVAQTHALFVDLYEAGGFWKEAQASAAEALRLYRALAGPDGAKTAAALVDLGRVSTRQGAWADARRAFDEALAIRQKRFGEVSAETAQVYQALGALAYAQARPADAVPWFERALSVHVKLAGDHREALVDDLLGEAKAYLAQDQAAAAKDVLERAKAMWPEGLLQSERRQLEFDEARCRWLLEPAQRPQAELELGALTGKLSAPGREEALRWLERRGVKVRIDAGP